MNNGLSQVTYGLYLLATKIGPVKNACIIDTCMQVATSPDRIAISCMKNNLTCDMIQRSGIFTISILDDSTPFTLIQHFGFQSGKTIDKFKDMKLPLNAYDIPYLDRCCIGTITAKVLVTINLGSHFLFIAEVLESLSLSNNHPLTYLYYKQVLKPKKIVGWKCDNCGYVFEGESLPKYYICPTCGHPKEQFQPLEKSDVMKDKKCTLDVYICEPCGYEYDPNIGDPLNDIPPGTPFEKLPEDWLCPSCGAPKQAFIKKDK